MLYGVVIRERERKKERKKEKSRGITGV